MPVGVLRSMTRPAGGAEGLPDILAPDLDVIFCGINPATSAARVGRSFSSPTNRFWQVLHRSGFTPRLLRPEQDRSILRHRCGLTVAVTRATPQAADLTRQEMRDARAALERKVAEHAPRVVAFLGKAAFAAMTDAPDVPWGRQAERFAGAIAWVLPNPSGRNRSFRTEDLVRAYDALRAYVATGTRAASEV
jgi:double-stranded uracil-DNA glycosylase